MEDRKHKISKLHENNDIRQRSLNLDDVFRFTVARKKHISE